MDSGVDSGMDSGVDSGAVSGAGASATAKPGPGNRGRFDDGWNNTAPLAPKPGGRSGGRRRIARAEPVIVDGEANLIRSGGDSDFSQGDPVRHEKFGRGVVKSAEGDKLTVVFEGVGVKKVVAKFVDPA